MHTKDILTVEPGAENYHFIPAFSPDLFLQNHGTCLTFCMTAMKNPPVFC